MQDSKLWGDAAIRHVADGYQRFFDALTKIEELLPNDLHDWEIHGVDASDRYVRIKQLIEESRSVRPKVMPGAL